MNLKFFVNADAIAKEFGDLKKDVEEAITLGVKQIASMTHAKTQEMASSTLKSTRDTYMKALSFKEEQKGIWVVTLNESAMFIEEGRKSGDMIPDLLKKNAKIAKDGSRYKVIPFDQAKNPSSTPASSNMFVNQVKQELKQRGIPYKKIEFGPDGSPRIGRLHTIKDIKSLKPSSRADFGALSGLTIYQTKTASGKIKRDILTFRVASTKHQGSKWIHPGLPAQKFMDKALDWAIGVFDKEILPAILDNFKATGGPK